MLTVTDLHFSYGKKEVLQGLNLSLQSGEILAVMGPSGCGKSTLLQLIAGQIKPSSGTIQCSAKRIAYAFQEPRLFPWFTVKENLAAVLNSKESEEEKQEKILAALRNVELEECLELYPEELSGGMKQRIAIARALAIYPDLLIMDEPFKGLDEETEKHTKKILAKFLEGRTALLVTHSSNDFDICHEILRLERIDKSTLSHVNV